MNITAPGTWQGISAGVGDIVQLLAAKQNRDYMRQQMAQQAFNFEQQKQQQVQQQALARQLGQAIAPPQTPEPGQPSVPMVQPQQARPPMLGVPPYQTVDSVQQQRIPKIDMGRTLTPPKVEDNGVLPQGQLPPLEQVLSKIDPQYRMAAMEQLRPLYAMQRQEELQRLKLEKPELITKNLKNDMVQQMWRYPDGREVPYGEPTHKFAKQISSPTDTYLGEELSRGATIQAAWEKLYTGKEISGLNKLSTKEKIRVRNLEEQLRSKLGLTYAEVAMFPTNIKAKQKAASNLFQWGEFVKKSQAQLEGTMDKAIEYSKLLPLSDIQRINKLIIAGKTEFGSGAAAQYGLMMNSVKTEYGRLMTGPTSNAMLPVEAIKKADSLISTADSPEQLAALKSAIMAEAQITKKSVQDQIDDINSSMLSPYGASDKALIYKYLE